MKMATPGEGGKSDYRGSQGSLLECLSHPNNLMKKYLIFFSKKKAVAFRGGHQGVQP
jgi:hypothetical protein